MKKSISRIIGLTMLIIAIVFIMFALNHPEKSFPWSNTITWLLYGVYFLVTVVLLIAPKITASISDALSASVKRRKAGRSGVTLGKEGGKDAAVRRKNKK